MASLNVDIDILKDPRWMKLVAKVGDVYKAMGMLVNAWMLAQKHWLEHKAIPAKAWPKEFEILIELELAERLDDKFIYVKGSEKQFKWLEQRSKAGKIGGAAISEKKLEQLKTARDVKAKKQQKLAQKRIKNTEAIDSISEAAVTTKSANFSENSSEPPLIDHFGDNCHQSEKVLKTAEKVGKMPKISEAVVNRTEAGLKPLSLSLSLSNITNNFDTNVSQLLPPQSKTSETQTLGDLTAPKVSAKENAKKSFVDFKTESELMNQLPEKTKARWQMIYQDQNFLRREFLKAFNWYEANPKRKPKNLRGWIMALSSWFERSWPRYQKTIETKKAGFSQAEINEIMKGNY